MGPDLLHLAEPLPLAPFRSPVLEPHLGERGGHGAVSKGTPGASLAGLGLSCALGWEHPGKIWSPALDTRAWLGPPMAPASHSLYFPRRRQLPRIWLLPAVLRVPASSRQGVQIHLGVLVPGWNRQHWGFPQAQPWL